MSLASILGMMHLQIECKEQMRSLWKANEVIVEGLVEGQMDKYGVGQEGSYSDKMKSSISFIHPAL